MKDKHIDELEVQRQAIMKKIWQREARERRKKNRAVVGKFFRYRNSYSGGRPAWWLYVAVEGMDESGGLIGWSFQDDTEGRMTVEKKKSLYDLGGDYREITKAEFVQAWKEFRIVLPK